MFFRLRVTFPLHAAANALIELGGVQVVTKSTLTRTCPRSDLHRRRELRMNLKRHTGRSPQRFTERFSLHACMHFTVPVCARRAAA